MNKLFYVFKLVARLVLPKTVVVGIDIQERHVAMVANTRRLDEGGDYISGVEQLPEGTIVGGELKNPHVLFNAVQKLMSQIPASKLKYEPVIVLSVPPTHLYTEFAIFPLMTREALEEAVRLKLETSLPWPIEETYKDWKLRKMGDVTRTGVFIAAASKQFLDEYFKVFQRGGWRVAACEFHLLSLSHVGHVADGRGAHLFILLDEDGVEFGVFGRNDLMVHFIKSMPMADAGKGSETLPALDTRITFETKRLIAYAETELDMRIEGVLLFNKIGMQTQMEQLQKEIDLPVNVFSPSENPSLYVALGASARPFGIPETTINFLPSGSGGRYNENLILRTINLWANALTVVSLVLMATFIGFWMLLRGQVETVQQEASRVNSTLNSKVAYAGELIEFAKDFNRLADIAETAETHDTNLGLRVSAVLDEAQREEISIRRIIKEFAQQPSFRAEILSPTRDALLRFKAQVEALRAPLPDAAGAAAIDAAAAPFMFSSVSMPVIQLAQETDISIEVAFTY